MTEQIWIQANPIIIQQFAQPPAVLPESKINIEKFKEAVVNKNDTENSKYLNDCLQELFHPNNVLQPLIDGTDLLKCITGGLPVEEFLTYISNQPYLDKNNDKSKICGKFLSERDFGFRCKTCSSNPTMFLCLECFKNGNHETHDFSLHRSSAGATCDCGDLALICREGCCKRHIENENEVDSLVEDEINKCAEFVLPHLLYRLLQFFRQEEVVSKCDKIYSSSYNIDYFYSTIFMPSENMFFRLNTHMQLLNRFCKSGSGLRKIIVRTLLNENCYKKFIENESKASEVNVTSTESQHEKYKFSALDEKIERMKTYVKCPEQYDINQLTKIEFNHMLDELVFMWIYMKTPDQLTTFFLNLMTEMNLRTSFMKSYISKYCLIDFQAIQYSQSLVLQTSPLITFISVTLFGNSVYRKDYDNILFFKAVLTSLYNLFQVPSVLKTDEKSKNQVMDCSNRLVDSKTITALITDLFELLQDKDMCYEFLSDKEAFLIWIQLLAYLQGMNVNVRNSFNGFDYYRASFEIEFLQSSFALSCLNQIGKDPTKVGIILNAIEIINKKLVKWIDGIVVNEGILPNIDHLTFHLPLHRYYSNFLYKAIHLLNIPLEQVIPSDPTTVLNLLTHPLQIQMALHEISANIWGKNGEGMKHQAEVYVSVNYCKPFIDSDLFLIQCLVCQLEPNLAIDLLFKMMRDENSLTDHQKGAILTGVLVIIAHIIELEISLDYCDKDSLKNEILQILCRDDCALSTIGSMVPLIHHWKASNIEINKLTNEVADYLRDDNSTILKSTKYAPKDKSWEESYDPLFSMFYRSSKDSSDPVYERYTKYVHSKDLCTNKTKLVPPYRLPSENTMKNNKLKSKYKIVNSRTLHALLFKILFERLTTDKISDKLFHLTIYIIELAVNCIEYVSHEDVKSDTNSERYSESNYTNWFTSNSILENMCEVVPHIIHYREEESSNSDGKGNRKQETVVVGESMISILIKLLFKLKSKEGADSEEIKFKFKCETNQSRIGDEAYFLNNLLNKAANLNNRCAEKVKETLKLFSTDESHLIEANDEVHEDAIKQKMKAQVRQQRILEKIGKMQQDFLNTMKFDKSLKRQVSQVSFDETADENPNAYDCCICQTSACPTLDRPIGLICQAMSTSATGFYDCSNKKFNLLEETFTDENRFFAKEAKRAQLLIETFTSDSSKESINIGYRGGAFINTCGHYLHFNCYIEFIQTNNKVGRSFECPLCRQPSNLLMPVKNSIINKQKLLRINSAVIQNNNLTESSNEFITHILTSEYIIEPKYLRKMMFCDNFTIETLSNIMPSQYKYVNSSSTLTNIAIPIHLLNDADLNLFITSILRTQLQVSSLINSRKTKGSKANRSCFIPLFDVLSTRCRLVCLETKSHVKAWNLLTKPRNDPQVDESVKREVPVLLRDPIAMFLLIILNLPTEIHRNTYQRIFNTVFNLTYIQNILIAIMQTDNEKRTTMSAARKQDELKSIDDYYSYIDHKVQTSKMDLFIITNESKVLTNQQEMKSYVENLCLPFLKLASLLQSYLFNEEPEDNLSFDALLNYLQMNNDYKETDNEHIELIKWYDTDRVTILNAWFYELIAAYTINETKIQSLFSLGKHIYNPPELIDLPHKYMDLFFKYGDKTCENCKFKGGFSEAICLICGKFVTTCCNSNCVNHLNKCYLNCGIYLMLYSTNTVLYVNGRAAKWVSLYLDEYEEEDIDLKRGKPLYLSVERYNMLKQLWYSHNYQEQSLVWLN